MENMRVFRLVLNLSIEGKHLILRGEQFHGVGAATGNTPLLLSLDQIRDGH